MLLSTTIAAALETCWQTITDIEHCDQWITSIQQIEILTKPEQGIVGLKWTETRMMFGKPATEVMQITQSQPQQYYQVQSESCGTLFDSKMALKQTDNGVELSMQIDTKPLTYSAKIASFLLSWMMKGQFKKALQQDLDDIKKHCEKIETRQTVS
ncbi:SRPBCC family protein [Salinimonas marina]|uniref:SRPBCC family protein n=1 Tax=Salinimonas marina TaxID=2785918 RepID=A0A7S9DZB6_9ALTE|nr:SRPBCC family protein [Salinimonas marina]QPG06703.1 SRPBCC family protein [Salinimonas marina]